MLLLYLCPHATTTNTSFNNKATMMFKTKAAASAKLMIIPLSLLWKSIKLMRIYYLCAQAHPPRTFCATFLYRMTIIDAEPPGPHIHTIYIYIQAFLVCSNNNSALYLFIFPCISLGGRDTGCCRESQSLLGPPQDKTELLLYLYAMPWRSV